MCILCTLFLCLLLNPIFEVSGQCSDPPSIGNGFVISVGPYQNGTAAIYTCQTGYSMTGDANGVFCSGTTWTGTQPTCTVEQIDSEISAAIWVLVAIGILVAIALIIGLVLLVWWCCCRDKGKKNKVSTDIDKEKNEHVAKSEGGRDQPNPYNHFYPPGHPYWIDVDGTPSTIHMDGRTARYMYRKGVSQKFVQTDSSGGRGMKASSIDRPPKSTIATQTTTNQVLTESTGSPQSTTFVKHGQDLQAYDTYSQSLDHSTDKTTTPLPQQAPVHHEDNDNNSSTPRNTHEKRENGDIKIGTNKDNIKNDSGDRSDLIVPAITPVASTDTGPSSGPSSTRDKTNKSKEAKKPQMWLPHTKPMRSINTSTK